jgi:hypothetical protein
MGGGTSKAREKSGVGADMLVVVVVAADPTASYGLYPEEVVADADVLVVVVVAGDAAASYASYGLYPEEGVTDADVIVEAVVAGGLTS